MSKQQQQKEQKQATAFQTTTTTTRNYRSFRLYILHILFKKTVVLEVIECMFCEQGYFLQKVVLQVDADILIVAEGLGVVLIHFFEIPKILGKHTFH